MYSEQSLKQSIAFFLATDVMVSIRNQIQEPSGVALPYSKAPGNDLEQYTSHLFTPGLHIFTPVNRGGNHCVTFITKIYNDTKNIVVGLFLSRVEDYETYGPGPSPGGTLPVKLGATLCEKTDWGSKPAINVE